LGKSNECESGARGRSDYHGENLRANLTTKHIGIKGSAVFCVKAQLPDNVGWLLLQERSLPAVDTANWFASDGQVTCLDHPAFAGHSSEHHIDAIAEVNHQLY